MYEIIKTTERHILTYFTPFSSVTIIEQVNVSWGKYTTNAMSQAMLLEINYGSFWDIGKCKEYWKV